MRRALVTALAMLVPCLWLGGATEVGLVATAGAVALVLAWVSRTTAARISTAARWALLAFAVAGSWTALQLVPLPPAALHLLSPHAAELWRTAEAVAEHAPAWHSISLDPPATRFALATQLTTIGYFLAAARLGNTVDGRASLVRGVILAVLVFDLVALAHPLFGVPTLYGVYTPEHAFGSTLLVAPLLNMNHAAALASLAIPPLLGIAAEAHDLGLGVLSLTGAATSAAVVIMTMSRSGIAVLLLETAAMVAFTAVWNRRRHGGRRAVAMGAVVLVAAVSAGLFVGKEALLRGAGDRDLSKIQLAARAYAVVRDFPLTGAGRGAFGGVFAAYQDRAHPLLSNGVAGNARISHAEHWPAQLAADLGVPVAGAVVLLFIAAALKSRRSAFSRPSHFGAFAAVVGLLVHDLMDFSTEFAGVAGVGATLFASVVARGAFDSEESESPPQALHFFGAALFLGCATLVLPIRGHDAEEDATRIGERWRGRQLASSEQEIRSSLLRHPAEPYFPMAEGVRRFSSLEGGRALVHAVLLGPSRAQGHFWLARWFYGAGRAGQAYGEYREALRLNPALLPVIMDDMIDEAAPLDDILAIIRDESEYDAAALSLSTRHREADAVRVDEAAIALFPTPVSAWTRQIARAKAKGRPDVALEFARTIEAQAPQRFEGYLAESELTSDEDAAERVLERGLREIPDSTELLEALLFRQGRRVGLAGLGPTIERLRELRRARDGGVYRVHALLGDIEKARGHDAAALTHYLDAAAASPSGVDSLEEAAAAADRLGRFQLSEVLWRRLAEHFPDDPCFADRARKASQQRGTELEAAP